MHELDPCIKLTVLNPEGTLHARKRTLSGSERVEGGRKKMGVRK